MSRLPRWLRVCAWIAPFLVIATVHAQVQDAAPAADAPTGKKSESVEANEPQPVEIAVRLLERDPFDRITLDAANGGAAIDTVLLDLPERRVPNPLPTEGSLSVRRLSEPSIPYTVDWAAIEKIELYEQMLLAEADRLTAAGEFAEAFEYLAFLSTNYAKLPGLEEARQAHLWKEASSAYTAGRRGEAWPVLGALYLRNPKFSRLANAVQAVSDDIITSHLQSGDYDAARAVHATLQSSFADLGLANIVKWQQRFESDAVAAMEKARAALAAGDYAEARQAVNRARSILPNVAGGEELWREIQTTAPEVRVGVFQAVDGAGISVLPTRAVARVADLTEPRLVHMVDFGSEGGVYGSHWGEVSSSDDGLETTITLSDEALHKGLSPNAIALHMVEIAAEQAAGFEDFATNLASVRIANGGEVVVRWRRPPIKPGSFLQFPLRRIVIHSSTDRSNGLWFDPVASDPSEKDRRFQRTGEASAGEGEARFLVEQYYADDELALAALMNGEVDAIDRVPPWQVERLRQAEGVVVGTYKLPTTHLLIPNPNSPLLQLREFRRALCYGIDSESIVRDILLAGQTQAGFTPLSGPFSAGASLTDPVAYAYNPQIPPRPFEPRLAALLAETARKTLAKREAEAKKKEQEAAAKDSTESTAQPEQKAEGAAADSDQKSADETKAAEEEAELPPPEPLILAHSTDPLARLACQSIKLQLDAIGIPIRLAEFHGGAPAEDMKYDLVYAEAAMWEPLTDARRLLGRTGLAGRTSPLMAMALDQLATSQNWNQALAKLKEIHRIAHYDLSVVPLWQTVNYFAHRKSLEGVGEAPVTLYQNLPSWRKAFE